MKFLSRICVLLILLTSISACAKTSNILLTEDFSTNNNKWDKVTNNDMTTDYYNNGYRILVNQTNYDAWANPDDLSFTDVQIEVDATKKGGVDYNDFGIICRYTSKSSYYYATVSSDGFYAIMKKTSEGGKQLGTGAEQSSDKITQGPATNHIRFDCVGSTLTLYVNGTQLDQQTDADYTTGNIGLIAGTYTDAGTDIFCDNLMVYKP
jgi:hypothetical protein